MCGINGMYGLENLDDPRGIIVKMNQAIQHRGPDAEGVFQSKNVALGHRRLKIIDLSDVANQPFHSKDGRYTLVFNGEIYNYQSLQAELSDEFGFITNSDTEVVLYALIKWGKEAFSRFNGMFAIAFWDDHTETLLLGRDRMGIKPLYYSYHNNRLIFSSEIKGILATKLVSTEIDQENLMEYIHYQTVYGENTVLRDVQLMPPASWLSMQDNEVKTGTYWKIELQQSRNWNSEAELHQLVRNRFQESVQKRLVADVPFGAFLSGGIDSSLVVAAMAAAQSQPVKTFHISFAEKEFSEAEYAQQVAEKYGTEHTNIQLHPNDLLNILPDALNAMDHPSGDGPNSYLVSKVTKEAGVTMVHSGLGGDELFAGYPVFRQLSELSEKKWLLSFPKALRRAIGNLNKWRNPSVQAEKLVDVLSLDYFDLQRAYPISRKNLSKAQFRNYFQGSDQWKNPLEKRVEELVGYNTLVFDLPYLSKISVVELRTYLHATLLRDTDQMSMAHALEVRVPFLDHELVQLVLSVPDQFKLGATPKQLLINSFKNELPNQIVNRPKMGFVFPWEKWMKNALKDFCLDRLSVVEDQGFFTKGTISKFTDAFFKEKDKSITWSRVWPLVTLGHWIKTIHE